MTVQIDSHGEDCWKVPSHYWCAAKKIEQLKAEKLAETARVTEAMLMLERHHRCLAIDGPVVLQVVRMECPVCTWISAERAKDKDRE